MTRRRFGFTLVLAGVAGCLPIGCGSWHPLGLRSKDKEPAPSRSELMTEGDEESSREEPGSTKGFFKKSRLPAALSSEAAEIENSLGVGGR